MKSRPNIVFITIDSLRADFVGYQNSSEKNTPFLDSIAKKSIVFTNAISPANPTFFTYCSIMTGALPFAFGSYLGIPDKDEINTIADVVKDNGYTTHAFIADSPALYAEYGYGKGFDYYDDGYKDANKLSLYLGKSLWKLRQSTPEPIIKIIEICRQFLKSAFIPPKISVPGERLNQKIKKQFSIKQSGPFFLWAHYMDSHIPYYSGLNKYFYEKETFIKRMVKKFIFFKELPISLRKMKLKNTEITDIFKEGYRSAIKYTDRQLNNIVTFLQNKYPNTVFIITSDHGEAFMEHNNFFAHEPFSLYNELVHIPLIIYGPSIKPKVISKTVSLVSIAKTISDLAGIQKTKFQGNDLLKDKIYSPTNNISRILYGCRSPHVRLGILDNKTEIFGYKSLWSFTTENEKYIVNENGKTKEYYSLLNDPKEMKNIMNKKSINRHLINKLEKIIAESSKFD